MNIPSHLSPSEVRNFLQRQINMGRYMILGTVIITAVNLLLLLCNADFYITYSVAAAYYLVVLGKGFDSPTFSVNGTYTMTGLAMAVAVLAIYLVFWFLAKKNILWIKVSMGLLIADAVILVLFVVGAQGNLADCLWELVIHAAVLWEMGKAVSARKQLDAMYVPEAPQHEEMEVPV